MLCDIRTKLQMKNLKPPIGSTTRWAGVIPMITWMNENMIAICEYDGRHPQDCATLEDGSHYGDYLMTFQDWDLLKQLVCSFFYCKVVYI